jgi:hypothetical protein
MPLDLATFQQAIPVPAAVPTDPNVKWPIKGYTITRAQDASDEGGDFVVLTLDGNGDTGLPYVLRPGDEPGLPFAEELYREVEAGLIVIQPAAGS